MTRTVTTTFSDNSQHIYENVPDDVTPDMIEARASGQFPTKKITGIEGVKSQPDTFAETPGGAATGIQLQPRLLSEAGDRLSTIGGATGIGAVMGAVAPEILTGVAGALRQIPAGARVAPLVESAAIAARTAGRKVTALSGGVSGLASETGGQVAEAMGAPQWGAEVTRFVAGGITPEALPLAKRAIEFGASIYKKRLPTTLEESAARQLAFKIAAMMEGRPQDIGEAEAVLLNKLVAEMRSGPATDKPMRDVYGLFQTGAKTRLALGEQEAITLMRDANFSIKNELDAAIKIGDYTTVAGQRISSRGQGVLATAQLQRLNIGDDLPPSDIGNNLRSVIVKRNKIAVDARRSQDDLLRGQRDTLVAAQESAGNYVDLMPEYKVLVESLNAETKPGKHSPEVAGNFAHILRQITTKAKEADIPFGGMGQDVDAIEKPPVSFQQLDDVRRQLGEVFRGKPPEGYAAIDAATARRYYGQIATLQQKYAGGDGGAHDLLQRSYADATDGLHMFGSKGGKRVTAIDRYDDTKFQTDAAALPRQFFSTKQGVTDLIQLTGNRAEVMNAAKNFATSELSGMNERQVREWMTKRREMLSTLPEVRDAVLKYANHLQYGEQTALRAERGVGKLTAYREGQEKLAGQRGSAIEREATTKAGQITSQRRQEAMSLLGQKGEMFPVQNVKSLIESGNSKQWDIAAPAIMAYPGGAGMLEDSIRQVMANRAMTSTKGLAAFFDDNVRPALSATRLMRPYRMDIISAQLKAIEQMKLTEPEKIGLARRLVLQSFTGYTASGAARGGSSLANLIPDQASPASAPPTQ